jgi:protoporphyrinogen oxidase
MSWMWGKFLTRRRLDGKEAAKEMLGYPGTSFEPLFAALRADIEAHGGKVALDCPVRRVDTDPDGLRVHLGAPGSYRRGTDPGAFDQAGSEVFDAVLATVPSDIFDGLAGDVLSDGYRALLHGTEYHAALCLLLEVDRQVSPYYWINIADTTVPFVGLVEHTNLIDSGHYGGRRFLYVANYVEPGDPLLDLDADALLAHYLPGLRKVNPAFDLGWVKARWLHADLAGQPIVTLGYHDRMPAMRTGVAGLVLANTTQIYPEDRGTNYAVREGEQAAQALLEECGLA